MVFSLVLLAPSWGGMINGVMTLSGAWHKLRDDPILKFLIVSLSFYGMSTFEGPMMSIKTVNALSHYTDWTIGHVHSGALGWVGLVSMGSLYYLIPRMFGRTTMYSVPAINVHFWISTLGIVLYIAAMWIAGVMQGLMWRALNPDGTLVYTFVEGVKATFPFYLIRLTGGLLYLAGMGVMSWNVVMTIKNGCGPPVGDPAAGARLRRTAMTNPAVKSTASGHERIETSNLLMIVLILITVAIGGLVEIVPLYFQRSTTQPVPGLQALQRAAAGGSRHLRARGLLQLPLADDPAAARRDAALRPLLGGRRVRSTTIRSSGAASAPAPTWLASAASTATTGSACIWPRRATSCPNRTCRPTPGWTTRPSTRPAWRRTCAHCSDWVCPTATTTSPPPPMR